MNSIIRTRTTYTIQVPAGQVVVAHDEKDGWLIISHDLSGPITAEELEGVVVAEIAHIKREIVVKERQSRFLDRFRQAIFNSTASDRAAKPKGTRKK